ncbi:WbqC family protein [Flagellimonas meridianipacifica]|uniref:WbqC-like protein n=1 Tax=Flagellimonas meridianipacifica TaxID=1080225 RepID=A0A2T0M9R1_9FLAO|nr:WbqC family protein [Allomuricauda pacifica]PRX54213.1 WbqC-like protein [Allomuricauda pacifica]
MSVVLHPTYFPSIATFAVIAQKEIIWEVFDNFQKQTYRNRCYICTDQGRHMMNIPIKHVGVNEGRQLYSDVVLDKSTPWQKQHWRTLETAYRTSPYFEFYEDDIKPLYENTEEHLFNFNVKTVETILDCLGIQKEFGTTLKYNAQLEHMADGRFLVEAKKDIEIQYQEYEQVFGDRHGFINNLSILDLLFNEGPNTVDYLMNQSLKFL